MKRLVMLTVVATLLTASVGCRSMGYRGWGWPGFWRGDDCGCGVNTGVPVYGGVIDGGVYLQDGTALQKPPIPGPNANTDPA